MATLLLSKYRYSVFMSYAFDDDEGWNWWVTNFDTELNRTLPSRLRGIELPRTHLSSENGPLQGPLNDALRSNVADSYAMLLFVHDNYVDSTWCLRELEHFKELFGDRGFRDRLYIIAMSAGAIDRLRSKPAWRDLFPFEDPVWLPFHQDTDPEQPITIYLDVVGRKHLVIRSEFWDRFVRLREDLAQKIRHDVEADRRLPSYPTAAPAAAVVSPEDRNLVRVYIESNPEQQQFWEPLGQQVAGSWDQVVALERIEPPLYLRPTGLPMSEIDQRPMLQDADGVVLLWGKKTPESLAAQISQVEPKLSGPKFAPGLVAYLMETAADQPASATINNWPVVRFATRNDGSATVVADDAPTLARFLRSVLAHKRGA